jgi:hypothetical protein
LITIIVVGQVGKEFFGVGRSEEERSTTKNTKDTKEGTKKTGVTP